MFWSNCSRSAAPETETTASASRILGARSILVCQHRLQLRRAPSVSPSKALQQVAATCDRQPQLFVCFNALGHHVKSEAPLPVYSVACLASWGTSAMSRVSRSTWWSSSCALRAFLVSSIRMP